MCMKLVLLDLCTKNPTIQFVSVPLQIFVSLSSGSSLLTVPESVKSIPSRLAKALRSVTVLQATPTLIRRFGREELRCGLLGPDSKLRVLAFGGESCPDHNTLATWKDCKVVMYF